MANEDDESNSDGLEILAIGALYAGVWDKKYWSSSRGKDRYPYPVGYQALRTHKGVTYKMEILEGLKGPIFQITSNDEQFGSGETPDRAWENFQKKCCSRIKLWPGKRASGKFDGVEFLGFKNALVQRLLRELVATVNDASDRSSVITHSNEASSKGKRRRSCRVIDTKSDCKSGYGKSQPSHQVDNAKVPYSSPEKTHTDGSLISCAMIDFNADEASKVLPNLEPGENVPTYGMPLKSHDVLANSKSDLLQAQIESPSRETCAADSSLGISLLQEEKPFDRSCVPEREVDLPAATEEGDQEMQVLPNMQEPGVSMQEDSQVNHFSDLIVPDTYETQQATEEGNQEMQVLPDLQEPGPSIQKDSQVNRYSNLIVPDTYETQQEITCDPNFACLEGELAIVRDEPVAAALFSEEKISESHSKEGSQSLNDNSEKSDFDSVDEDMTKTMLAILLPRAVPYLTYSSRKKRRKTKVAKDFSCEPKEENNSNEAIPSADVKSPAGILSSSNSDGKRTAHLPSVIESSLSTMNLIVPDSLDNDHYEDLMNDKLSPPFDNGESVAVNLLEKQELDNKLSSAECDATDSSSHENKIILSKEAFAHEELQKDLDGMSLKNSVLALHSAIPAPSSVLVDLAAKSEDQCLNADGNFKTIEHCSKITDPEIMPDFDVSGKQQSSPINEHSKMGTFGAPLSESIVCRNSTNNFAPEMHDLPGSMVSPNSNEDNVFGGDDSTKAAFIEGKVEGQISNLLNQTMKEELDQNCVPQEPTMNFSINKKDMQNIECSNERSDSYIEKDTIKNQNSGMMYESEEKGCDSSGPHIRKEETKISSSCEGKRDLSDERKDTVKFIGCYSHPMRISSIMLTRKPHEIYICVSCGLPEERKRDLFLYTLTAKEPSLGSPCMVGHTSMSLPSLKDEFGREVVVDKSALQFTPDGKGLALIDSIRMPYCREKNLHCLCSQCESHCFEENAVKIVQVKLGFISIVVKLKTMFPVHCVLVCEPEHLIALDESGRIYIWIMNSTWSAQTESYIIPSYEFFPSRIVDLKRIPKSSSLVIGHNGYGEFSLWDIIRRSVVSRFSAAASSVLDFLPISLFSWPSKGLTQDKVVIEGCLRKLQEETVSWFSSEANIFCPKEGQDAAVWLFLRTSVDSHPQSACYSINNHLTSDGCWRLGLMIKDVVILGAALGLSTTAVGISSGTGIIGNLAGQVYIWDLAEGSKQEALHDFEGRKVLHIATDDPTSTVVAIARDGGELCVYLRT